jgi:RimJ/RimL family protein N-acetyltransferase
MKSYLGGTESDDAVLARHERILDNDRTGKGKMFLITVPGSTEPVGSVGYWERDWQGETVYELAGGSAQPQGRGLAVAATVTTIGLAAAEHRHRWAHAYPRVANAGSNAVCRKAGFELLGEVDFEYPKGNPIRCNDWRYDLTSLSGSAVGSGSARSRA